MNRVDDKFPVFTETRLHTDTLSCAPSGCAGDGDHQQIGPEAVRELGFCQRQAAVQILPERSGRAAAQTVAPLEESRRDGGEVGTAGAVHL